MNLTGHFESAARELAITSCIHSYVHLTNTRRLSVVVVLGFARLVCTRNSNGTE